MALRVRIIDRRRVSQRGGGWREEEGDEKKKVGMKRRRRDGLPSEASPSTLSEFCSVFSPIRGNQSLL